MWVTSGANQAMREVSRVERFVRLVVGAAHVEDGEFLAAHGGDLERDHGRGVNPSQDDASGVACRADGGVGGVLFRGAIDGAIHTAAGGIGQDLACGVELGGVERSVCSHVCGQVAAVRQGIDGPDAAGAGDFETGDGQQADGSGAEHGDRFAGLYGGKSHGVHSDGQRLDDGGQFQGKIRWNGEQVGDRQVDELPEKAGVAGIAQEADAGADVVVAAAAELAVVAVECRFERSPVARLPAGNAGPGLHHRAGRFVAQHHGIFARSVADGAFRVGMEIAAADADGTDPHLDFAGGRVFDRFFGQLELALRDEFGYQHYEVPSAHCKISLHAEFSPVRSGTRSVWP